MKFSIRGIGIIKEADIKVEGLTVIAGSNNSGKTTAGRALYSVTSAVENLEKKQKMDRAAAVVTRIRKITEPFSEWLSMHRNLTMHNEENPNEFLREILEVQHLFVAMKLDYYIDLLFRLCESVENGSFIEILLQDNNNIIKNSESEIRSEWENNKEKMQKECKSAIAFVESFRMQTKKEFACKLIEKTLQVEFSEQVQSFSAIEENKTSVIKFENAEKQCYEFFLNNNKVLTEESNFIEGYYDNVYFIDDPYIMEDSMIPTYWKTHREESYVQGRIIPHREKMRRMMRTTNAEREISEIIYQEKEFQNIMEKINAIVPGSVARGVYRTVSGKKIKVGNLATGSKVFSIIKEILSKIDLADKNLLILDEPESHLHPSWINQLAEVIVLLVKECNVTVLLTTHSPNFLLAIDALMRKYEIREKCHFYQTELEDENQIKYVEKTDCLDALYSDFAASFSKMNALRKKYMNMEE